MSTTATQQDKPAIPEAIERLIAVLSAQATLAQAHRSAYAEAADEDSEAALWTLKEAIDWQSGFFVDWKDSESFVQCLQQLAQAWGASLSFGVEDALDEDFLDEHDVPELMQRAHAELAAQGLTLWNWDTEGDCYAGWITRSDSAATVQQCSEQLGVEIREGSEPF